MGYAAIAAAILGGAAGSQKDVTKQTGWSGTTSSIGLRNFQDLIKGQSQLESNSYDNQLSTLLGLQNMTNAGPGQADVTANQQYQNQFGGQLADMLQKLNNPTQADIQGNYDKAKTIFAPQQVALDQQFEQANNDSNRLAARLGRPGNDPILRNKLMQEKTRQQTMLNAQVGSYGMNELPQQQKSNLFDLGGALSNLKQGLASQAFSNRQMLMQMGNTLLNSERSYRLGTANHITNNENEQTTASGGGFKGAVSGALGGASSMMGGGGMGGMGK